MVMEFNFTDGSLRASMPGMFYRTRPDTTIAPATPSPPESTAVDKGPQKPACKSGLVRWWLAHMGAALDRAEQRIMDNFKVPPHGG